MDAPAVARQQVLRARHLCLEVGDDPRHGQGDLVGRNHFGVVADNLDDVAQRLAHAGLESYHHTAYEPGRRFYFRGPDQIECEVVSDS